MSLFCIPAMGRSLWGRQGSTGAAFHTDAALPEAMLLQMLLEWKKDQSFLAPGTLHLRQSSLSASWDRCAAELLARDCKLQQQGGRLAQAVGAWRSLTVEYMESMLGVSRTGQKTCCNSGARCIMQRCLGRSALEPDSVSSCFALM